MDTEKVESVLNHLVINSEAEMWYDLLPVAAKADWRKFETTPELNWPREIVVMVTIAKKRAKLTKE